MGPASVQDMPRQIHQLSHALPEGPSRRNRGLFSDNFLENHIPPLAGGDLATAQSLRHQINDLCVRAVERVAGRREASVEDVLIRPVLKLLGFTYAPNPPLPTGSGTEAPDYALFDSPEAEQAAQAHTDGGQYFEHCLALAEAKPWDRPLGATARKGRTRKERRHPGKQIRDYLYESGVGWGILTNGRLWRLYNREASRGENYYEVDLIGISADDDPNVWRYFYLFFRRQAFEIQADGRRPLDAWLDGSRDYAVGLTKRLRDNVYEALRYLMEGFFAWQGNNLDWERDWRRVHQGSLVLLYRLFFVLYAEARDLMPVANPAYRDAYSLQHRKRQIAEQLDRGGGYDRFGSSLWNWLRDDLFRLVDEGHQSLGVPQYNGGLFRAERWPLLHDPKIRLPDHYMAQAIDLLARDAAADGKGQTKAFVDYSELGVRELGSIYEGLLEMRPHLALEPMIEVRPAAKSKQPDIIPESAATEEQKRWSQRHGERYAPGQVYLLTDRGERKQTGSYYTPEYIVNYIVENALAPLTDEAARQVAERRPQAEREIAKREKVIAERGDAMDTSAERDVVEHLKLELLEPYFDLKVLDPAMGSGHFLVGAADFITDAILTDPNHLPPVEADGDEALYYKRRVVERCLYGVDINPLAVELAKLSLWLHTVQKDRALSFLDHHLRCGNSLIGAWVEKDLSKAPPILDKRGRQVSEDGGQLLLGFYDTLRSRHLESLLAVLSQIEETPTINAASEAQKNLLYKQLDEQRNPYRQVANLWLGHYFLPSASPKNSKRDRAMLLREVASQYDEAIEGLAAGAESEQWAALVARPWFQAAQKVAADNHFFHWELEFPEVWYERGRHKENPGFDAVIGNPPYENAWAMTDLDDVARSAIAMCAEDSSVLVGHWDLYVPFISRALALLRRCGRHSFIVPDALAREGYARRLREQLTNQNRIVRWTHFEGENVFDDVSRHCAIYCLCKESARDDAHVTVDAPPAPVPRGRSLYVVLHSNWLVGSNEQFRPCEHAAALSGILHHAEECSVKLGQYCYVMVGATTHSKDGRSYTKSDVVSRSPRGNAKRFFDGKSLRRYEIQWDGRYLDYRSQTMYGPRVAELFESPKIVIRDVTAQNEQLVIAFDDEGLYCDHLVTCVTPYENVEGTGAQVAFQGYPRLCGTAPSLHYTLAIVASRLMSWYFGAVFATGTLQGSYSHTYPQQIRAFPIRRIHFTTPASERTALLQELKDRYDQWVLSQADSGDLILARVEGLLPKDEQGRFLAFAPGATGAEEKSDVVHDFLAYLADQMVELNKQKQAEIRRFLEWLQTEVGHELTDLRQKTRILHYHEGGLDDLLAALRANDKTLVRIAHRSTFQTDLRREFDLSLSRLSPLKARIAATDALIDRIVYRLYGLTEEEIAVVADARATADVQSA
jgi:hypothetical protein